ncbi:MAG: hypothetical protein E7270_02725 [Lachnospiraceae bacterium]|nr:hypothetical protein [Lachnospiraceae bacterium]MBQ4069130.1 hypothetical protein [Lachnospiraceae bacterium]
MNNRSRYVPALIMLTAGFVTCISTIIHNYTTEEILLITSGVMAVFLIVGFVVRFIIDRYIIIEETEDDEEKDKEKEDSEDGEEKEDDDKKSENTEK